MENINITVTTKTENGLNYNDPNIQYSPEDTINVNETWGIWVNGELCNQFIEYIKIKSVNVEYVVNEKEWYVSYNVGHYAYNTEITEVSLTNEDLEDI